MYSEYRSAKFSTGFPLWIMVAIWCLVCAANFGWAAISNANLKAELTEVTNGDDQFQLYQGYPNNRYMPCSVYYCFDKPVDASLLLEKIKTLASTYTLFNRNVVDVYTLPYWQQSNPD